MAKAETSTEWGTVQRPVTVPDQTFIISRILSSVNLDMLIRNLVLRGILRVSVTTDNIKIIRFNTRTNILDTINPIMPIKLNSVGTIRQITSVSTIRSITLSITLRTTVDNLTTVATTISLFPCIRAPEFTQHCLKNLQKRQSRTT